MEGMTRRERRAMRLLRFVTSKDARQAARMARLDYKVTNESGALRVHTHSLSWHLAKRPNGATPTPGQRRERSGPARVVEARGLSTLAQPMTHQQWRRLIATKSPENTNK